jgi:hypothetical protein
MRHRRLKVASERVVAVEVRQSSGARWTIRISCSVFGQMRRQTKSGLRTGGWSACTTQTGMATPTRPNASDDCGDVVTEPGAHPIQAETACTSPPQTPPPGALSNQPQAIPTSTTANVHRASSRCAALRSSRSLGRRGHPATGSAGPWAPRPRGQHGAGDATIQQTAGRHDEADTGLLRRR